MNQELEVRLILSILNAWKHDGTKDECPWHVTDLGWHVYARHPHPDVRATALNHPFYGCPSKDLQQRKQEFKMFVQVAS